MQKNQTHKTNLYLAIIACRKRKVYVSNSSMHFCPVIETDEKSWATLTDRALNVLQINVDRWCTWWNWCHKYYINTMHPMSIHKKLRTTNKYKTKTSNEVTVPITQKYKSFMHILVKTQKACIMSIHCFANMVAGYKTHYWSLSWNAKKVGETTLLYSKQTKRYQCWTWSGFRIAIQPDSAIHNRIELDFEKNATRRDADIQTALITVSQMFNQSFFYKTGLDQIFGQ